LPVEGRAIEHGAVLIGEDGRIQVVGADSEVPRPAGVPSEEFGNSVIIPGLINTHTHLELTGFEHEVPEPDFPAWIRRLREAKAARSAAEYVSAARTGLKSCYSAGVTTVADTGDSGSVARALSEVDGSGIVYQEVFGPDPSQEAESLAGLRGKVESLRALAGSRLHVGVSPHAPYTVSGPLFRAVAAWARVEGLPLAVHIAESVDETKLLLDGSGGFAEAWQRRGIPLPEPLGLSPIAWLARHGVLASRTLCIHAVRVGPDDITQIADAGASVAHCPLSNRSHGHDSAPLSALLEAKVSVGLGTDSVVSVGRLDLLAEARAAGALASLDADQMIEMCTLGGARALKLDHAIGSLKAGKWGDCVVVALEGSFDSSPAAQVLASNPNDVLLTCLGGREVFRAL
jgi:cytosine/adenosine deaminase-related metal-dependent hydrolase